jgi:long-chain acyl-CoA synthetase
MNIVKIIRQETAGLPANKTAVRAEAGELSYAELFCAVDAVAGVLSGQGIAACTRVGLAFPDGVDYIILSLAVLTLDAVLLPVTVSAAREVAEDILEKTAAEFVISSSGALFAEAVRIECGSLSGQDAFYLARCTPVISLPEEFNEMEPAFIRFSSGTTGTSKGVLLTHPAIAERTDAANQALKITSADTVLWVLSMSFHFVVSILLFLRRGATICLCSEAFPFSFLSAVQRGDGTFIYATPFHYRTLAEGKTIGPEMLSGIRMAISTAMKLPPETAAAFRNKFGFGLTEAYGIIEVGLPFVNAADTKPEGSVGRALPGVELEIRNADENGNGEVWLRGPGMYAAYLSPWRRREANEWFATGDTGRLDQDGFLCLMGRTKNLINFAGMKVFPYEVEAVLDRCPGVQASLVYAEAHPRYGQLPCAKVEASGVTADELQRHCYEHLESYKVPKKIEIVTRLERTASGKIKRTS